MTGSQSIWRESPKTTAGATIAGGRHRDVTVTPHVRTFSYPAPCPVQYDVAYQERYVRWLPLVKWLLLLPHLIAFIFLSIAQVFACLWAGFAVVITGRYPESVFDYVVGVARWDMRIVAYWYMLTDDYPPFALYDMPSRPVRATLEYPPGGRVARWRPLFAWLLVLPHFVALVFLYIGLYLLLLVAFFSILFRGAFPRPIFDLAVRVLRWHAHVAGYALFTTATYPGFAI
jgi:Domain of unknown function (DUF4389)